MNSLNYLGSAIAYPIDIVGGKPRIATGKEVIENACIMILTTPIGTRLLNPEYGSNLSKRRYEPNDEVLSTLLRLDTLTALSRWEKRAKFMDAVVLMSNDAALITITYKILSSNEVGTFDFPFFRTQSFNY